MIRERNMTVILGKQKLSVPYGTCIHECFNSGLDRNNSKIIAARMNNEYASLMDRITVNCELVPIALHESSGQRIYQNSLIFLFEIAVHQVYPDRQTIIGHSLDNGFFYRFQDDSPSVSRQEAESIEGRMKEIVEDTQDIIPDEMSWTDMIEYYKSLGCESTVLLLRELNNSPLKIWRTDQYMTLRYSPMVENTGVLKEFSVKPYAEGLILGYPSHRTPQVLNQSRNKSQLYAVYKEYKRWGEILSVSNVASLNTLSRQRSTAKDFILTAEALHDRKIAEIAGKINQKSSEVKVVMIAGPSSSGKTTFMKKLALSLKSIGLHPKLVSLDDYYNRIENIPKDRDGKPDFEVLEALDVKLFNENIADLFAGKEVEIPVFDFKKTGGRLPRGRKTILNEDSVLLFEGIHGLNPNLAPDLDMGKAFRIYISALTTLNLDNHIRIPTTDNRLIRRIVRDHQFRQYSASDTLKIWSSVRRGEEKHIFPWQYLADTMFNSALDYELAILKVFAEPLLRTVSPVEEEYGEARRLLAFLDNFSPFPIEEVPLYSILREFIGRSGFHY